MTSQDGEPSSTAESRESIVLLIPTKKTDNVDSAVLNESICVPINLVEILNEETVSTGVCIVVKQYDDFHFICLIPLIHFY